MPCRDHRAVALFVAPGVRAALYPLGSGLPKPFRSAYGLRMTAALLPGCLERKKCSVSFFSRQAFVG